MKLLTVFRGYWRLFLLCVLTLSGCTTIKGYDGSVLPNDQLATVALDWRETSWGHEHIKVDNIALNTFKTIMVRPGQLRITLNSPYIVREEKIGGDSCSQSKTEYKNKKEKNVYNETTSCNSPYRVTENIQLCQIVFRAEAGQHYEAFTKNNRLMLINLNNRHIEQGICKDYDRSYETTKTSTSSDYDLPQ
ncbi:hypothetical protein [Methylomicrobium lacus]|uniref:hypothetical protein n=1 Tax=Methylomicrobium lacus TaxID=136992 RepID=UPI0035A8281E